MHEYSCNRHGGRHRRHGAAYNRWSLDMLKPPHLDGTLRAKYTGRSRGRRPRARARRCSAGSPTQHPLGSTTQRVFPVIETRLRMPRCAADVTVRVTLAGAVVTVRVTLVPSRGTKTPSGPDPQRRSVTTLRSPFQRPQHWHSAFTESGRGPVGPFGFSRLWLLPAPSRGLAHQARQSLCRRAGPGNPNRPHTLGQSGHIFTWPFRGCNRHA